VRKNKDVDRESVVESRGFGGEKRGVVGEA